MTIICRNMTLPKTFSLTSTNFNNFNTMSLEASSTNSLTVEQNNILQHDALLQLENKQRPNFSNLECSMTTESSPLTAIVHETNTVNNNSILAATDSDLLVENVMPGIYLTKTFMSWTKELLRVHCFTHVIIIDKHIQELYYPNHQPDIFKLCTNSNNKNIKRTEIGMRNASSASNPSVDGLHDDSSSLNAFDCFCPPIEAMSAALNFDKDFEVINLNFGEKSYLTTVLPNCYRAVKFINKALQSGCSILVIDCNGGEQKCLTIIVAYLMYKHNISFSNAFARLKEFYKKADLDRFYISQLYEYEPILQVQRAQSRGHSCSRELHAAILKRKKPHDDEEPPSSLTDYDVSSSCYILNNCNPLMRFDATQMDVRHNLKLSHRQQISNGELGHGSTTYTRFMTGTTTGGWYNWEDYAME